MKQEGSKMRSKRILSIGLTLAMCAGMVPATALPAAAVEDPAPVPIYLDTQYSFEERAADLVARMSLAQKGSQMISGKSAAIPAAQLGGGALDVPATVGISSYEWWSEALHGYSRGTGSGNSTSYPQSLSAGTTWNPDLYYREAVQISDEIRERTTKVTADGQNKGNAIDLTFYSPTVNMQRDPRWGRNEEAYSEDPLLNAVMGSAFVKGMEGKDLTTGELLDENGGYYKLVSTVKHYTANNSERNRLDGGAETDLRALREYYTAPYRNIIKTSDVSSLMTAYSTLNGEPCSMSSYLMDTLLRQTWGFSGYITSDCDSVSTIARHKYTNPHTGQTLTSVEQFSQAMAHGEDLECSGGYNSGVGNYSSNIAAMVAAGVDTDKGVFTENQVDVSLHRLMTARVKTGEFDADLALTAAANERVEAQKAAGGQVPNQTPERLKIAEDVAKEAVVLLQNDAPGGASEPILPLAIPAQGAYKMAIVGAWQTNMYLGVYSSGQSASDKLVNIQKGITDAVKAIAPDADFTYIVNNSLSDQDIAAIQAADAVVVVAGTDHSYSAEDRDRTTIILPNKQAELISQVGKLNQNTVAVLETCGPMQVDSFKDDVAAILWSSFGGVRKGVGFGGVLTGAVNPSGKLTATWHHDVDDKGESDIPPILDYDLYATNDSSGRTYMYYNGEKGVSYPFGYGLSYTDFTYSDLKVLKGENKSAAFDANDTIKVTFDVTNTGSKPGKEVVQLYVAQPDADPGLLRPAKRLEGFDKIELTPNETKTVTLEIAVPDLAFYNVDEDKYIVDTGKYQIQVGGSSADIELTSDIDVSGELTIVPEILTAKPNQAGDEAKGVEERLIFDKGKVVDPQLTVAMNDESLYGYIIADQKSPIKQMTSKEFPAGMTFAYSSNRPEVVKVEDDKITTVAPGVATITAKATYNGKTVETQFVVYVESTPYLEDIKVDGQSIPNFRNDRLDYNVEIKSEPPQVPTITWVTENDDLAVTITNADKVPGVTTIEVKNTATDETIEYRIGIGMMPIGVDFVNTNKDTLMDNGWLVENANDANVAFDEKGMTITSEQGAFTADVKPKNLYLQRAYGDWVAQTGMELSAPFTAAGQQAGLVVYDTDRGYLRFAYERVGSQNAIRICQFVDGKEGQIASANLGDQTKLFLQAVKRGDSFTFHYSTDGTNWKTLGSPVTAYMAEPKVGLMAANGASPDAPVFQAAFKGLDIFQVSSLYPRLSGLTVDGQTVPGFEAEKFTYNILVDDDETNVPKIAATPADGAQVDITPLAGPTGTAKVEVSTGAATTVYTVSFNHAPKSDYFAGGQMTEGQWEILQEDPEAYALETGKGLVLPTQRGDIHSTGGQWKNCFVTPAMGSWEAVAKVVYPQVPTANYQQAMMLVWQDEDNYIRVNCQQSALRLEPGLEVNGAFAASGLNQGFAEAAEDGTVTLYFKIIKDGLNYSVAFSQNGTSYEDLGTVTDVDFADPKIGLFATQNSSSAPIDVYFEYLTITELNGVDTMTYDQMLEGAVQNVLDYVVKDIPASTDQNIVLPAIPHGYSVTMTSSDPDLIGNDGVIHPSSEGEKSADVTVKVSDGVREKSSAPISVKVEQGLAPVTATPAAGSYVGAQSVTLSCATEGAAIYYTTDGSEPTEDSSLYTGPIAVDQSMTIKAFARLEGFKDTAVAEFKYNIMSSTDVDDAGGQGGEDPSEELTPLWQEYEDYFLMGSFGNWDNGQWIYHGNVGAPGNALKLDSQIGNSNTNSLSRQAYVKAVEEIEADTSLTPEEKAAKLQEANENVMLDPSRQANGLRALEACRQWNADHPDEEPKRVRAHVLAWHGGQQPNYFFSEGFYFDSTKPLSEQCVDPDTMLKRLDNYIQKMMEVYSEYKDIIICWDVVNEAIDDYTGQIRNSENYQVGQWGTVFRRADLDNDPDARLKAESAWVRQAFASARRWSEYYDCDWKLYYNDFQDSNKLYEPKMSQTIKMLEPIYDAGHIDGYGLQGRLAYAYPDIEQLKEQIELGLTVADEVSFSESDIRSDFIPNPNYDPNQPTRRVQEGDPEWPDNSGSFEHKGDANGNTFDVHNSPVMRDPRWGYGRNDALATSPEKMKAQADFAADLMDLLLEFDDKTLYPDKDIVAYQWDGTTDAGTFNSTTGCTMWAADGTPKYSFFAVAGAPNRAKLKALLADAPVDGEQGDYTAATWAAYQSAKKAAEAVVNERIYDQEGLTAVKTAAADLEQAIDKLRGTAAESASFLAKGNAPKVSIINQKSTKIVPGMGLLLTDVAGTIDGTANDPVDLVTAPAAGDWTATVKLDFKGGAKLGYYEYFNFVAMQDLDNFVGFQVGDGGVYLNKEIGAQRTALASANEGTKIADVQYYRIQKSGDDYTFFYSADGVDFTKTGEALDTGLANVELAFDAHCTNQWNGKTMYVEYLHVDDGSDGAVDMADFALNAALDYTVAALGDSVVFPVGSQSMQLPTLSGYTTTFEGGGDIVSATGLVTAPEESTEVELTVKVSDGKKTVASDPVTLTVSGMAYKVDSVTFDPAAMDRVTGDLRAKVTIINTTAADQDGLMILALYDGRNQMVNYSAVGKTVLAGAEENFETSFRVPFQAGGYEGYTAKVFVWDGTSMDNTKGNALSGAVIMPTTSAESFDLTELPAEPEVPETQEPPTEPETPETQEPPAEPETPETQEPPAESETPETQEPPAEPEAPEDQAPAPDGDIPQ